MNNHQMQPLSVKELEYISDSISNEDMQIKLCSAAAISSQTPAIQQACMQYVRIHEQHLQRLADSIRQHEALAPSHMQ
ncbi:hypothetical protein DCC85_06760 [Paenibacillus sp. CAA11]|uniref:hypothetical protein n=1 Tax=Paenibacillus sp. CAA11 TaxID=1532905 RepID=UPI000D3BC291|nr:hypothetical protein [Paenibacillus sp. CAA11]AWB43950.1 hypothetical protein DCC85_06760 [Paenibacillus sp. CAA11]